MRECRLTGSLLRAAVRQGRGGGTKAGLRGTGTVLQCDEFVQPQLQNESQGVLFLSHMHASAAEGKKIKQTNKKSKQPKQSKNLKKYKQI